MAKVVIRAPDGSVREAPITGEVTCGRAEGNGLVLAEGGVSRRHAKFTVGPGGAVTIEDLGSANGTFVNGERIRGPTPVPPGAEVALGDYRLTVKLAAGPRGSSGSRPAARGTRSGTSGSRPKVTTRPPPGVKDPGPPSATRMNPQARRAGAHGVERARKSPSALAPRRPPPSEAAPEGPRLRGLTGLWVNRVFPIQTAVVVGRIPPAEVVIADDSVSRRHAELEVTPEGVVLRDLGSANGTLLNGSPVTAEILLQPGDVIQVGVVELEFESDRAPLALPPGPSQGASPLAALKAMEPRKRILVLAGAAVGFLFLIGIIAKVAGGGGDPRPVAHVTKSGPAPLTAAQREAETEEALTKCRSYAATNTDTPPHWGLAEKACDHALDLDPINEEAHRLARRIVMEKKAKAHFERGTQDLLRLREDAALDELGKIPAKSYYYLQAKPKVVEAIAGAKKRAHDDCVRYARDGFDKEALPRCARYMTLACQEMTNDQLYPPLGFTLKLRGRLHRHQWRPKDAMYLTFLRVRAKVTPGADPWRCPQMKILHKAPGPTDDSGSVKKALLAKYHSRKLVLAMMDYWHGQGSQAVHRLEKILNRMSDATLHPQADSLRNDISTVDQLFQTGEGDLQQDDTEQAAVVFKEALKTDGDLMGDSAEKWPSTYRQNMRQDLAQQSYVEGKHWADRGELVRACGIWRTGFEFYKGNPDVLKAVAFCTGQAANGLASAGSCDDLTKVSQLAMQGDGIAEKVAERKKKMNCP